ncbi:MAG: tyrosine-type recombinase/integrase [Magnetococcales bacterium]|nr:tyrosine-type recombinase/integrase [Magnetococcales bacterium]MBF0152103.1 tyrosine-type recombinase/integrase [Magnetococcales bacterium]
MAIKKHSSGWQVDIQPGGRGGRRYRKTFSTKGEALRWEIFMKDRLRINSEWLPAKKDGRHMSELVDVWNKHHGQRLHFDQYKRLVALSQRLGDPVAASFDVQHFAAYRELRLADGLTPSTLNREHSYLRAMFHELKRLGLWSGENPMGGLRQLKVPERELSYLSTEQIQKLLVEVDKSGNPDVGLVVRICLSTGARWGEAEGLRAEQVHEWRIDFYGTGTKSGKNRTVPVSHDLVQQLRGRGVSHGRLFSSCAGAYRSAVKRMGLDLPDGQLTHVLRHTFASHFMMNGGNILVLQKILGHQSLAMTMRYSHLSPDHLKESIRFNPLANSVDTSLTGTSAVG